ncbi:MAG TPA: hypothetical protein VKZ53_23795 [Candidatus Angelobacter sp.]|nr:hypothetical protein [Candidatus Angelobacter sp.]
MLSNELRQASKDIPQLTDAYRQAKNRYVMTSGLFAVWTILGGALDIRARWGIEFKDGARPIMLFPLIAYFAFNTTTEWLQCDIERQKNKYARCDFFISHIIALVLTIVSLAPLTATPVMAGISVGTLSYMAFRELRSKIRKRTAFTVLAVAFVVMGYHAFHLHQLRWVVFGAAIGLAMMRLLEIFGTHVKLSPAGLSEDIKVVLE